MANTSPPNFIEELAKRLGNVAPKQKEESNREVENQREFSKGKEIYKKFVFEYLGTNIDQCSNFETSINFAWVEEKMINFRFWVVL